MKKQTSLKVVGAAAVGLITIAGCASSNDETSSAPSPDGRGGRGENIAVVDVDENGVASFVVGELGAIPAVEAHSANALAHSLQALAPQFHADPASLVLTAAQRDNIGDTHYRYAQRKNGRVVFGGELILHARDGNVYAANGSVRDDLPASAAATVRGSDARATVEAASRRLSDVIVGAAAELAYLQKEGALVLVYPVDVTGFDADLTPVHDTVLVDATTGEIALRSPHIHTAQNREVHNASNKEILPGAVVRREGQIAASDSVANGNFNNLGNTYECYKQLFQRDSYDNAGAALVSTIHYSNNYNNAYWDSASKQMVYGDGDGTVLRDLPTAADVTAHELTHAVTGATSNLTYSGQPGGLNEAMSDILGNTCEWFGKGKPAVPPPGTWLVGEECYTPAKAGDALRYMDDPAKDGKSLDYYPNYNSSIDVHYSSGIPNLAFYLLAHGGTHPRGKTNVQVAGIGIEKAAQIFYRANTSIFTSSTTFAAARTGTEQAAAQLGYDANVVASVSAAWAAVGVGGTIPPPGDAGTDSGPNSGTDSGPGGGSTCAHGQCANGGPLTKTCDPCVTKICATDSYCCRTAWDSTCVSEVTSICGATCN